LIDTPVFACRRRLRDRHIRDGSGNLGVIDAAKRELALNKKSASCLPPPRKKMNLSTELALLPVGWKKIPRVSEVMALFSKSESVMVGMDLLFSDNVPIVRSTGPIPKIPSTSSKPEDFVATPMDCCEILRLDDKVTVSMYSLPEKLPEPYVTDCITELVSGRRARSCSEHEPQCHRFSARILWAYISSLDSPQSMY
jgi:hypothetical protein